MVPFPELKLQAAYAVLEWANPASNVQAEVGGRRAFGALDWVVCPSVHMQAAGGWMQKNMQL